MFLFASVKGAPGVTTLVVGVAARWPAVGEVMVAEADPRGGDLAARFGLSSAPGLASAATDRRIMSDADVATGHAQPLPLANVAALLAPAHPVPATATVRAAVEAGVLTAIGRHRPLLIDAGVLDVASPVIPLCAAADVVLLVLRDRIEDLVHGAATLDLLADIRPAGGFGVVVRMTGGHSPSRIGRELGVPVFAEIPSEQLGASVLCGHAVAAPGWARLRLPRAAAGLARKLADYTPPAATSAALAGEEVGAP
jgi:MinD-like ATPase involved in chromosome partitioning or flagellar assembly